MKNEWEIKGINVPIFDLKLHGSMNKEVLNLHTEFMGRLTEEVVNFKSEAIRQALVSMGWTTPETGHAIKNVIARIENGGDIFKAKYWVSELRHAINQTDPAGDN